MRYFIKCDTATYFFYTCGAAGIESSYFYLQYKSSVFKNSGKPFMDGEVAKECIDTAAEVIRGEKQKRTFRARRSAIMICIRVGIVLNSW
mgnify:CR=1 FL=1